jgi:hypothetical protein
MSGEELVTEIIIHRCLTPCSECTRRYVSNILGKRFICRCSCHYHHDDKLVSEPKRELGREGRNNMTTNAVAEFKTTLKLCTLVSILEEEGEIDDRRRGKTSRAEFSNVILGGGGLPLSDQQEIKIMKTSVVPSGLRATNQNPRAAPVAVEEATTTPPTHRGSNSAEAEVLS